MSETAQGAGTGLRDDTGSVQEQATQMKDQALEKGGEQVRTQLDERTTQVGQQARSLADALRRTGSDLELQGDGSQPATRITYGIADRLERVGGYLEQVRGDDLLRDAEDFARRRPWIVAGAAAAAGFAASRFLKASSENRYDRQLQSSPQPWRPMESDPYQGSRYASPPTVTVGNAGAPAH